ncbi:MAG: phosphatase PAP2 family protein [bacterium]
MIIKKTAVVFLVLVLFLLFQSCEEKKTVPIQIKNPPVVKAIPLQVANEGDKFGELMLPDFVSDEKFSFNKLNISTSDTENIRISINSGGKIQIHVKDESWNGLDTLMIKITNPYNLTVELPLIVEVKPLNDSPVLSKIPDQQIFEGNSFTEIYLPGYVTDPDNSDTEITWSFKGNKELNTDLNKNKLFVSTPDADWHGTEILKIIASDGAGGYTSRFITFTVIPVNDAPRFLKIPVQVIEEGGIFAELNVNDYVIDVDNSISELTFETNFAGSIIVEIKDGVITALSPGTDWFGSEIIPITVSDPGGLFAKTEIQFIVKPVNDSPTLSKIPIQEIMEGESFNVINLSEFIKDIDNPPDEMDWRISHSVNIDTKISNNLLSASRLDEDWYGCDTLQLTVRDKGGLTSEIPIIFKVNEIPFFDLQPYKGIKNIAITGLNDFYSLITSPLRWESNDIVNFGIVFSGTIMLTGIDERVRESAIKNTDVINTDVMKAAEYYGHPEVSQLTALTFGAYGIAFNDDKALRIGLEVFEAYFISNNLQSILKRFIGRSRPEKGNGGFQYDPFPNTKVQEKSMPSGHSILAFTLSSVIAAHTESPYLKALIFTPAFLTAAQRIYADKHWFSDVFFGATLGYFVGNFVVGRHENGVEEKLFFTFDDVGRFGVGYKF